MAFFSFGSCRLYTFFTRWGFFPYFHGFRIVVFIMNCLGVAWIWRLRRVILPIFSKGVSSNAMYLRFIMPFFGRLLTNVSFRGVGRNTNASLFINTNSNAWDLLCGSNAVRTFEEVFACIAISTIVVRNFSRVVRGGSSTTGIQFYVLLRTI